MSLEKEYQLEYFEKNNFQRKTCTECKYPFWTQDPARVVCGDPPCVEYAFIGTPVTKRPFTLREMRERYLSFMEDRGHTRVDRYPVVARWRDDIYLTIASIADFQPHVTSGQVPPPANPLTISQPCIRLNDLDSVGRSGRHLTTFEMMAHHAFNYPDEKVYFKERTIELCHEFLTKSLGIDTKAISYKEKPWAGGGNAGAAFEVLVGGLEVATLVFMNLEAHPDGDIELYGERYRYMDMQIVDTGYGLERLAWCSDGSPTIYDALFPDILKAIMEGAGLTHDIKDAKVGPILAETARLAAMMDVSTGAKLNELRGQVHARLIEKGIDVTLEEMVAITEPLERVYAIADHARCLAFMLGDGIVPSNVKAGYLARLVLRKALRLLEELGDPMRLNDVVDMHLEILSEDFPELRERRAMIHEILDLEESRYRETMEKGRRLVEREAKKAQGSAGAEAFPLERLIDLYDSQGLAPEIVKSVAASLDVPVNVPDDFYSLVAEKHGKEKKQKAKVQPRRLDVPGTKLLYYESATTKEFEAVVLWAKGNEVILDQSAFYPEGGGQPDDRGFLLTDDDTFEIVDVQKENGKHGALVIHTFEGGGKLKSGTVVRGRIDWGRRISLMRNHTATHILGGATRRVLGPHIWQAGAQKGTDRSRIDITHFRRISDTELREIEQLANMVVLENLPVEKTWMPRNEADKKYGMQLYQGGVPKDSEVRVVRIPDFDVQACAGTHVRSTNEVGPIKVLKTERIQDGVERIEFSAGLAAINSMQATEDLLNATATVFNVSADQVPKTAERFFTEWKDLRKKVDELQHYAAQARKTELLAKAETVNGVRVVVDQGNQPMTELLTLAQELMKEERTVAILGSSDGGAKIVVSRSPDVAGVKSGDVVREATRAMGGGGGGKPDLAQGGAPDGSKLGIGIQAAKDVVRANLGS